MDKFTKEEMDLIKKLSTPKYSFTELARFIGTNRNIYESGFYTGVCECQKILIAARRLTQIREMSGEELLIFLDKELDKLREYNHE
jgi:uncharacterized protein YlaN (UPF0358 family)